MTKLNEKITLKIGDSLLIGRDSKGEEADSFTPPPPDDLWDDLNEAEEVVDPFDPDATKIDAAEQTSEVCDGYLTAEVLLP